MEIAIQNWIVKRYRDSKQITMLSRAGFKCYDWDLFRYYNSSSHKDESPLLLQRHFNEIKRILDGEGAHVCHTHAPFPTYMSSENKDKIMARLERSFEATAIMGSHYSVVHPQMPIFMEKPENRSERIKLNIAFYQEIRNFSQRYNVKIALENMFGTPSISGGYNMTAFSTAEELMEVFNALDDTEHFCICFDSGHANLLLKENCADMLAVFGGNVELLHLHDNYGRIDNHNLPLNGNMPWDKVFSALNKIGYNGVYNFEISPTAVAGFNKQAKLSAIYAQLTRFVAKYVNE